jgi:ketosteroid isomerase-like protein
MKYVFTILVASIILFTSCATQVGQNDSTQVDAVITALNVQEECWNNGDIDGFMNGYWSDDSLMFVSGDNVAYGWQKVLDNYKQKYHSPELMGKLIFDVVKTDQLSADAIMVIGSWKLERESVDIQGKFSLLWRKINGEWKIVIDHTS